MRINELDTVCTPDKQDRIHKFCDWCCNKLGINTPQLTLKPHNDTSALGYTNMDDSSVTVVVGDRHQMDIMRTLAHELVHVRQMESYEPDGATGSDDENEANAMAGVLMREWGQQNPDLYTEGVNVSKNTDEARFSMKKPKPSAQDRFNKRLKDKHGIDLDANLKFYQDMQKKFQKSMDTKKADENFGEPSADAKKRAGAAQQKNIDDKYVDTVDSNSKAGIYKNTSEAQKCWKGYEKKGTKKMFGKTVNNCVKKESVEIELEESKTARMMALITALGAAYGLEDDAREFAHKISQNIDNAQNAEPNPGRPDPVTKGNPLPGADRVMRPPVDEMGAGGVAMAMGRHALKKSRQEIDDDEANEASTTSKILKGAPGAPSGRPKSMREAVNVQSIKDEVMGAVRSGNPSEMKRIDDTIAKRIRDLMDLRGTAGKEVDAEIMNALPVLKKAQMYLRDKKKVAEGDVDEAKKDACYNKVRSRYKVWPSAYASGALVQCRKKGAANWGNKSKK